jgi:hypothetical protein
MNYLTKFIFLIFFFLSNIVIANDNEIIFQVNKKIYSTVDLKNRIKYLEVLNSENYNSEIKIEIINDYFSSVIFYEYAKSNKSLNNILEKESKIVLEKILVNNDELKNILNKDTIIKNINYDFARKIVLENILNNYQEYIFSNPKDINFIYNYKLKYITIPIVNLHTNNEFKDLINSKNFNNLSDYLIKNNINYHSEEIEIKDLNKINTTINNLINSPRNFIFEKNSDFYRIIKVEKKLDIINGVYYRLINIETNNKISEDKNNCTYIKSLNNIKSSKEYEYNKLNNEIKNNLIAINDFIIFQNNDLYNYIFLCEIRVNEEFLKEININKKIKFLAKNIETDFINKYSKIYNSKKYYE